MQEIVAQASDVIKNGGVILYPTDTIWGLGCDPTNEKAIEKIIEIKKRDWNKSFILLINSEFLLNKYVEKVPEIAYDLVDLADKPLTIIYPKGKNVSNKILAEDGSIALRKTKHHFCNELMNRLKSGIVSTSANFSGDKSPSTFSEISEELKNMVDFIVPIEQEDKPAQPSQIIKVGLNSEIKIIRK